MSLFEQLVAVAIDGQNELAPLQIVVEKELLHHDIIREMSKAGLLKHLTFIGGTCLRACYGSNRLSEDLDFTGGSNFTKDSLVSLASILTRQLKKKYDLNVTVTEPVKESGNVDTWKLKIATGTKQSKRPTQRIHIDICAIPSYDRRPRIMRNHYGVDMGTSGLIIQAQSREEILADKMVAFALRPNRIKNRDIWDIGWLKQQNIKLPVNLVWKKLADRHYDFDRYISVLSERINLLVENPQIHHDFVNEMKRFLPPQVVSDTINKDEFWSYLCSIVKEETGLIKVDLQKNANIFRM